MGQLICQSLINGTGSCLVSLDGFLLVERLKGLLDLAVQNLVCSLCANFALFMVTVSWKVLCRSGPAIKRTWVSLCSGWIGLKRRLAAQTDSTLR